MTELEKFEEFMKNYQDLVYGTALRLLGNETDAQDIAQTVFLKAYQAFGSLAHSPTAGGWLKTVTRNLCLNHLTRNRWRFFSEMRTAEDEPDFSETLAAPEQIGHGLDEVDQRQWLQAALCKLPEAQRVPLVLYHFEELAYEEISERLGSSLSKVKTDIHRGRLALKRHLRLGRVDDERFADKPQPPSSRPAS
jgi:RNA polymerase sigma-70 factor (ECF subfamily)